MFILTHPHVVFFRKEVRLIDRALRNVKLVNAALRPAQHVDVAFALVKAAPRESLGIIKKRKICLYEIKTLFKEIFTEKHFLIIIKGFAKTIKEQIFTGLLKIFTVI